MDEEAPPFMAFCTYMTSKFWVTNIKANKGTAKRVDLKIGDKVVKVYSMHGKTVKTLPTDGYLMDGAIQASILGLNTAVDSFYQRNNKLAFTPLARVSISDNRLDELSRIIVDMIPDNERAKYRIGKTLAVKELNVCTARKSWQMIDSTIHYIPELAIACLLRSMASENVKATTKEIGQKQIRKIVNAAGSNIDIAGVTSMMGCLTGVGSSGIDTEKIINDWKSMGYRTKYLPESYRSFQPFGRTVASYKVESETDVSQYRCQ